VALGPARLWSRSAPLAEGAASVLKRGIGVWTNLVRNYLTCGSRTRYLNIHSAPVGHILVEQLTHHPALAASSARRCL